jgi:hypothetical protein
MRYIFLFVAFTALPTANMSGEEIPRELKPVMVWTGTETRQAKETFARCSTRKEWEAIWQQHQADANTNAPKCPEINFDSFMVVAIFHGNSSLNNGIEIRAVLEEKDCIRLRYRPLWYQYSCISLILRMEDGTTSEIEPKIATRSFAFVVLPCSRKSVVLEEDDHHIIGDAPAWKERAKFAPAAKK